MPLAKTSVLCYNDGYYQQKMGIERITLVTTVKYSHTKPRQ